MIWALMSILWEQFENWLCGWVYLSYKSKQEKDIEFDEDSKTYM